MKDRTNDIDFIRRALFLAFFSLFIFVFSDNTIKQDTKHISPELVSDQHSALKATPIEFCKTPSFQKTWISSIDRMHFRLPDRNLKILADHNIISQKLISLEKNQFLTEAITDCQFYYLLFPKLSIEVPLLS